VGQGDCTLVQYPDGSVLAVDAGDGSWGNDNHLYRYLKGLAPTAVTIVVTHADRDHYGGCEELMKDFPVDKIYLPVVDSTASAYRRLLSDVEQSGCETDTLTRYDVISSDCGAYAVCISPYSQGETEENAASTVLYLHYLSVNILLCGDMTAERQSLLAAEYALDEALFDSGTFSVRLDETDIYRMPHHGSAYSVSEAWAELISPAVCILSDGQGNQYGHPSAEALAAFRESEIYRTDELGDVVVRIGEDGYRIETDFCNGTE